MSQPVPFVRRIRITNYRSIESCDVTFEPLTVLVGFNAAGKSNLLDALSFVADALQHGPVEAAQLRGGPSAVLHRGSTEVATSLRIQLELDLVQRGHVAAAAYGFEVGVDPEGDEPLVVLSEFASFDSDEFVFLASGRQLRLQLPAAAVEPGEESDLVTALSAMRFYDLDTEVLRQLVERRESRVQLGARGALVGPVIGRIGLDPVGKERFDAYLGALVPGLKGVDERREGRFSTIQARFATPDGGEDVFLPESLSEGTLRATGVLAALFQPAARDGRIRLVAIEEPETALHPAGVAALYEAFDDAARDVQVIVTTQSSELLDSEYADPGQVQVVTNVEGSTRVGPIDDAGRQLIESGVAGLAELHRGGQLAPDAGAGR